MKIFANKKRSAAIGAVTAAALVGGTVAYAYFSTTGSGTGSASVGTSTALTLNQASITYSNAPVNELLPGTSASVTFTVDNPSSGAQFLDTISLAQVTSANKPACNSTDHPSWFSATEVTVEDDYIPGNAQAVPGSMTITFVNAPEPQDVCKGAVLDFAYASN